MMKLFLTMLIVVSSPLFVYATIDINLNCSDAKNVPLKEEKNMTAEQYYHLGVRHLCDQQAKEQEGLSLIQEFDEFLMDTVNSFLGRDIDLEGIQYIKKAADLGSIQANYLMGTYHLTNKTLDASQSILDNIHQESMNFVNFNKAILYYENAAQLIQFILKNPSITSEQITQSYINVAVFVNLPVLHFMKYIHLFSDSITSASIDQQQEILTVLNTIDRTTKSCIDQLTFYQRINFPLGDDFENYEVLSSHCRSIADLISDELYNLEYARSRRVKTMQCENFLFNSTCFEHYQYSDMTDDIYKILRNFLERNKRKNIKLIF